MDQNQRPSWVLSQENGSIGEARTRSFLIDRFWILERSIDIDGADFIVQRRLTQRSLLDRVPPTLGFIQSKFFGTENTAQYIKREYVEDAEKNPRKEFFCLCHSGTEDNAKVFLLTAEDIVKNFTLTEADHSRPDSFYLPRKNVELPAYQVMDKKAALDRIEKSLLDADFKKNRMFVSWFLPPVSSTRPAIDPLYQEPIDNWYGDIQELFDDMRSEAGSIAWDLREMSKRLTEIGESTDPVKAFEILDDFSYEYEYTNDWIKKKLYKEEFETVSKQHKEIHQLLEKSGLLNNFRILKNEVSEYCFDEMHKLVLSEKDTHVVFDIEYSQESLKKIKLGSRVAEPAEKFPDRIVSAKAGHITVAIRPRNHRFTFHGDDWKDKNRWESNVRRLVPGLVRDIFEKILALRFEELS